MQPPVDSKLSCDAMKIHGMEGVFFCTFSSKKATAHFSLNNYTQSISGEFSCCSFTGNDPRKGWRIPLNRIKYNEQRDEETGYGYFGARYMDHELLTSFISVDRYASKYPSISPYAYCAWNPIKLIDPSGDTCKPASDAETKYIMQLLDPENKNYSKAFSDVYQDLDNAEYIYVFESWSGDESADGRFTPSSEKILAGLSGTKIYSPE